MSFISEDQLYNLSETTAGINIPLQKNNANKIGHGMYCKIYLILIGLVLMP